MGRLKLTTARTMVLTGCGEILVNKVLRKHVKETLDVVEFA